jgi:hypothetical protein
MADRGALRKPSRCPRKSSRADALKPIALGSRKGTRSFPLAFLIYLRNAVSCLLRIGSANCR